MLPGWQEKPVVNTLPRANAACMFSHPFWVPRRPLCCSNYNTAASETTQKSYISIVSKAQLYMKASPAWRGRRLRAVGRLRRAGPHATPALAKAPAGMIHVPVLLPGNHPSVRDCAYSPASSPRLQGWALRGAPMGIALNKTFIANVQALAPNPSDNVRRGWGHSAFSCFCGRRIGLPCSSCSLPAAARSNRAVCPAHTHPDAMQDALYKLISTFGTHYVNKVRPLQPQACCACNSQSGRRHC